jgi:hypothetical protein
MTAPDIVRANPYARAEYRGIEYAERGKCIECGGRTHRYWRFEMYSGRKHNIGYFCDFDCLSGHHGFSADDWT